MTRRLIVAGWLAASTTWFALVSFCALIAQEDVWLKSEKRYLVRHFDWSAVWQVSGVGSAVFTALAAAALIARADFGRITA